MDKQGTLTNDVQDPDRKQPLTLRITDDTFRSHGG